MQSSRNYKRMIHRFQKKKTFTASNGQWNVIRNRYMGIFSSRSNSMHLSSGRTAWRRTDRNSGFDAVHEGIGRVSISRTHHLRSLVQPNGAGQSDHGPTNRSQQPPYKPAELLELEPYYASQR